MVAQRLSGFRHQIELPLRVSRCFHILSPVRRTHLNRHLSAPNISALCSSRETQTRTFWSSFPHRHSSEVAYSTTASSSSSTSATEPFTILFCGRDAFSCTVFNEVYNAKDVWNSLHIVTNPDVRAGRRGSRLDISPLKAVGETLGVPVHLIPKDKPAFKQWLPPPPFTPQTGNPSFSNASHLLITASFGRILPPSILRLFPDTHRLNVHPSLLPAYRGPAPIQRALMAGEEETGVCVIEMGEVSRKQGKLVDAGGIWAVERTPIPENANFLQMQETLAERGGKILVQVLRDMLSGTAHRTPQDGVTPRTPHAPALEARDSVIHFELQTAVIITRLERGLGHQRTLTVPTGLPDGRAVAIAGLHVIPIELTESELYCAGAARYSPETNSLVVRCAEGTSLSVERLQTQDKVMLPAKDWWNGVKSMGWVKNGTFRFGSRQGQ